MLEGKILPYCKNNTSFSVFSYFGGSDASEIGDVSIVHCLTAWLPEPIPLEKLYTERVWKLLLNLLPNWKLPKPPAAPVEEPCMNRKSMFMLSSVRN